MAWTRFMDMHSGGRSKEKFEYLYIEAPEKEARVIFYNRFGHNPERVTCTCCGDDYSIEEEETLEQATAFERGCHFDEKAGKYVERKSERYGWREYQTLEDYLKRPEIAVIRAGEIKDDERQGEVPQQGYVWVE